MGIRGTTGSGGKGSAESLESILMKNGNTSGTRIDGLLG